MYGLKERQMNHPRNERACWYCGQHGGLHAMWCRERMAELDSERADRGEEKRPFGGPPLCQPPQRLPSSFVPPEELISSALPLPAEEHSPQGGGFKRTEAEIEAERGQRRMLVVVQWNGEEPYKATAHLVEILVKPDDSFVVRNRWPLTEVGPTLARKQSSDPLRGEPYGIVVGFEMESFKTLDELNPSAMDLGLATEDIAALTRGK